MPLLTLPTVDAFAPSGRAKALVFEDPKSSELLDRIREVSSTRGNVLISGETGTGKELVARYLHDLSQGAQGPFLTINCGALSESLADSDLFGLEADRAGSGRGGWFEAADGGTLGASVYRKAIIDSHRFGLIKSEFAFESWAEPSFLNQVLKEQNLESYWRQYDTSGKPKS